MFMWISHHAAILVSSSLNVATRMFGTMLLRLNADVVSPMMF